jgi:polyisoprenyl-teichoic acid--peptidoglycan teichoic acid transferase
MAPPRGRSRGVLISAYGVLCSMVLPGAGHMAVGANLRHRKVIAMFVLGLVSSLAFVVLVAPVGTKADLADVVADRRRFMAMAMSLVLMTITRVWAAADVAWTARPRRGRFATAVAGALAATIIVTAATPMVVAANYIWTTDRVVEQVFGTNDPITAQPGAVPTTSTSTTSTTSTTVAPTTSGASSTSSSTSTSTSTSTTLAPFAGTDRLNVLLLGGDAGAGRWNLRTDSMVLVSIDPDTGDTALISVPRNLRHLPFPPGTALAGRFPNGFDDLANAVYPYVDTRRELAGGGADAGAQAVKLGIAQLLGIPIQYYVLVDMAGFVNVVDALGGIDIDVPKRVPTPGNPPGSKHPVPEYIEAGLQHLDGTLALAYARSREADSDYQRMQRQRCVLSAIATSATPQALATGLGGLVDAFGDSVRTDIPREQLGELAVVIDRFAKAGGVLAARTLQLTPPVLQPSNWDAAKVRELVTTVLYPPPLPPDFVGVLAPACA